ncbi:hypothetical protein SAMN04489724_2601 [Algoriphagus locisalis]|uniref:Uncharacterized protein n=1 Tax=Algoriphagus locisalis TaxID=305507 RepID=A0A1I7BPW6_9BACT|nr:hypothetical protein [Algoriphagus locisalis]SFT89217.1 hypothetical protein SAMN04489724_2601 [Algoriphagus locisalis]
MEPYDILGLEAYRDPLGEITRLFTEVMDLQGWRSELRTFENGLYRTKKTYMGNKPKAHKRILRELEKMLAAGMKLSEEHFDFYKVEKVKLKNILPLGADEKVKYNYSALPVFLSQEEMVNPVLTLYDIYVERPFDRWLELVRQWSSICESEQTIENYDFMAFVPEFYNPPEITILYRILESCHLLAIRNLEYSKESLRKWLGKNWGEIWNRSYLSIKTKFDFYDIQFWRELLETIRSGYYDSQPVWHGKNPSDFIRYIGYLKKIVTHAEVLSKYHTDAQAESFSYAGIEEATREGANMEIYHADFPKQFPLYLDANEVESPIYFLWSFFKEDDARTWNEFLDKCLLECMDHFGSLESHFSSRTQKKINELIKVVEACNLILIKLNPENESKEPVQSK